MGNIHLLAHLLKDALSISLKIRKKGGGINNKSCLRAFRPIVDHLYSSNPPGFQVSPPPPYIKWITPFCFCDSKEID